MASPGDEGERPLRGQLGVGSDHVLADAAGHQAAEELNLERKTVEDIDTC